MTSRELLPILLSCIAGVATAIGACFAVGFNPKNKKMLAVSLGFAGGVMAILSFVELLPESLDLMVKELPELMGWLMVGLGFILGMLIASLVEKTLEISEQKKDRKNAKLYKVGITTMVAMALHNFPEGIITFIAGYQDIRLGLVVALGIILHNIPEGIAIGAPIYAATGSRKKAIGYSLLSGLSEPVAALLTMLFFKNFVTDFLLSVSLSFVAGIMVNIAFFELFTTAKEQSTSKTAVCSFAVGAVFMGIIVTFL